MGVHQGWAGAVAAAAVLSAIAAKADVIVIDAAADTTIYQDNAAYSNGAGDYFFAGNNAGSLSRRALLRFDLSMIPYGSTIHDATLTLNMSRTMSDDHYVWVHKVLSPWGEGASDAPANEGGGTDAMLGDATWMFRVYFSDLWQNLGGDYAPTPSAVTLVGLDTGAYSWNDPALTADVAGWVAAPATNHGWILIGNEVGAQTTKRFDSRTNPAGTKRPKLIITYTPAAPMEGACCVPGLGCSVMLSTACASAGGTFKGANTVCDPDPCAPAVGACCLPTGACVTATAPQCANYGGVYAGDGVPCASISCPVPLTPFVDELPSPGVMQPVSGVPGGAATYAIAMTEFLHQMHRDLPPTRVWGYDGTFPAKTIEARRNQPVRVNWINDLRVLETGQLRTEHVLPVDTCLHGPNQNGSVPYTMVHLHGGHVPSEFDGQPDYAFPPGTSSGEYLYPNIQPASMMWYHDHGLGITRLNVEMGLAGLYLLRDDAEAALNLPSGANEVPLVIMDRSFNPDGSIRYADTAVEHFFGDFAVVNGKIWPYKVVNRGKYRFRVLNGCTSRVLTLSLSNGATFQQISTDLGLLPAPVTLSSLTLGPAERADIILDFAGYAPGTEIVLRNTAPAPYPGGGGVELPQIMKFVVASPAGHTGTVPGNLVPVPPIPESEAAQFREFVLQKTVDTTCGHGTIWTINGLLWDDITEHPVLGTTEVWSFINRSGVMHPMHMHLVSFQILDRQDFVVQGGVVVPVGPQVPPEANEAGWKDTVRANPWQITRVIARFQNFGGRFAYHCHILEHEDNEMMRQFEVCGPASFNAEPEDEQACAGTTAMLYAHATGTSLSYVWRRNGQALSDGPTGTGSVIFGANDYTLRIENAGGEDGGTYDCVATNACSEAVSREAVLTVVYCCDPDVNCDGAVNGFDVEIMELAVGGDFTDFCQADADYNRDGAVNGFDVEAVELSVGGEPCP
ncbi:MAG: hypothetical protein HBSAPP03_26430 [Phycisphaerae bacterium]|nr:MAG: hypothetical protein HBSAPP03_26430 [Phycisphaerae bacterium]